jgi:citrate lyase subunit beta/citryl-CoA lyase
MSESLHPADVLYPGGRAFPALPACEHYAGSEKLLGKALALQVQLAADGRAIFDITGDCEDGAPAGCERDHAVMIASLIDSPANQFDRIGARIHDVRHAAWREELEALVSGAGRRLAYLVLPKPECVEDARTQIAALDDACERHRIGREIPVHVLIETPGALRDAWEIARLPHVESLDFGLMDFVSAHHGAIPGAAMRSPGQFEHPLVVRAKCEIAAAALGNGVVPSHNVSIELRDMAVVHDDARRARQEFGYLRMWSIHPSQIQPIVDAMRPDFTEVADAAAILVSAQNADWGPIQREGRLHDRASYRYFWELLLRARSTGMSIPADARLRFFS